MTKKVALPSYCHVVDDEMDSLLDWILQKVHATKAFFIIQKLSLLCIFFFFFLFSFSFLFSSSDWRSLVSLRPPPLMNLHFFRGWGIRGRMGGGGESWEGEGAGGGEEEGDELPDKTVALALSRICLVEENICIRNARIRGILNCSECTLLCS